MQLLSMKGDVDLTYARLADGTLVESLTFDVGEAVEIVAEDGTKTPAPDGEHDLKLMGANGEEVYIKVRTEGGTIVERENVEMMEEVEVQKIPQANEPDPADVREDLPGSVQMEEDEEVLPEDEDKEEMKKRYESMAYRIEELEKRISKMEEMTPMEETEDTVEEEDLPKLDGAPTEMTKLSAQAPTKTPFGKKEATSQSSFLLKLYR